MPAHEDVEEFAALLRRLKERTDRSYGSLARRLSMNTSTLHRYCAGEAVPLDYAPVERFAVLCGASADERLELHRVWLQAVAARQRPRGTGPAEGVAEPADDTAGPGGPADEADGSGGPADGTTGSADAPESPEPPQPTGPPRPVEPLESSGRPEPSRPRESRDTADPSRTQKPVDVPESSPTHEPTGIPESSRTPVTLASSPRAGTSPAPLRRPWYRRRRTAVTAAAATVLAVTLGSLSALSADRHPDGGTAQAPPASRSSAPVTLHSPSAAPASPSPGASVTRSPSAHAKASASRPGSGTGTRKGSESGGGSAPGGQDSAGVPLTWSADSQVWALGCAHDYVIDKPPAQVPPPPAAQDAAPWAATQGAVHGRETNVRISVQGRSSTAVVLEALRVRVVGRAAPVRGTVYAMEQGCGGEISPRYFAVDLDQDRPIARSVAGADSEHTIPAVSMPYRVSAEDPEVLLVTARTENCACDWYLELDWSSQGRTGTVRVDDHGRPFRTSGIKGLPRYWYGSNDAGERRWVPTD